VLGFVCAQEITREFSVAEVEGLSQNAPGQRRAFKAWGVALERILRICSKCQ
jgi:hypothetical protein